jgi:hypothetical protein
MNLDLRIPMGMMFTLVGGILTAYGIATYNTPGFYAQSLGIDANLWWGLVLLVFGVIMLFLGRRGQRQIEKDRLLPPDPHEEQEARRGH